MEQIDHGSTEAVREALRKYSPDALPLTHADNCNGETAQDFLAAGAKKLFPEARSPQAALSGLLLLTGCWEQSHEVSQDIETPDGSYWHGIAHRMEPDSANATYWFRRVGEHAIFPELRERAIGILEQSGVQQWKLATVWDPYLFLEWCDEARRKPGSKEEQAACKMQGAEWELLFAWCAAQPTLGR